MTAITKLSFAADRAEVIKNNEFSIVRNTKEEQNSSYEHHENDNIAADSTNVVSSPLVGIFYSAAHLMKKILSVSVIQ